MESYTTNNNEQIAQSEINAAEESQWDNDERILKKISKKKKKMKKLKKLIKKYGYAPKEKRKYKKLKKNVYALQKRRKSQKKEDRFDKFRYDVRLELMNLKYREQLLMMLLISDDPKGREMLTTKMIEQGMRKPDLLGGDVYDV